MTIEQDLALGALLAHPLESAQVLEALPSDEAAQFLARVRPDAAAACLRSMHVPAASESLAAMGAERGGAVLAALPLDIAAACLRRLEDDRREPLLQALGERRARSLRTSLRFDPDTAGSLMDPAVLSLPQDLTADEARTHVREAAEEARYNLYLVDRNHRLSGVCNLRELFLADGTAPLSSIARPSPHRLRADADPHAIVSHPGWREAHALPVVDRDGVYLGAVRYRVLRRLEAELRGDEGEMGATARALGDLFRTGASSLLEAMASAPAGGGSRDGA